DRVASKSLAADFDLSAGEFSEEPTGEIERERGITSVVRSIDTKRLKKVAKDARRRQAVRPLYRAIEKTDEWAENNYYRLRMQEQGPDLIAMNAYWRDFARRDPARPFVSPKFLEATGSFAEMMLALSVLDLPIKPTPPATSVTGT